MVGRIVRSKSGHDAGRFYVVLQAAGDFVFVSDGRLRPINKPKRKNVKHISITNTFMDMSVLTDEAIRKELSRFDEAVFKGGK